MLLKKWQLKMFDKNFLILKCSKLSFTWLTLTLSRFFKTQKLILKKVLENESQQDLV